MDTKAPVFLVLSIGVGVAIFQGSGGAAILESGPSDDLRSGDELESSADQHNIDEGYKGQVNPQSDSDIVGLILGSSARFIGILTIPGLLSGELMKLGVWWWAAIPVGLLANLITYIGGFQVIVGRMYE